ncbi:hypothetical protein MTO96_019929 [Rhipicephalus appendiculatus]
MAVAAAPQANSQTLSLATGCVQAAQEALPMDGYCGCRSHYVPGQGLVVAYRCSYHAGQQDDGAEDWQWYDDTYEQQPVGFDVGEYEPGFDVPNWNVGDSNEKTRKEFDRRRATAATKDASAEEAKWPCPRMWTSEPSMLPAYVVLFTLIACLLIAIGAVSILPNVEEGRQHRVRHRDAAAIGVDSAPR